jgi:glycosyltransferase involved in cell wall biosynthesis
MKPIISVIIPTFNYGRFVEEAIESVRQQSFSDWECLVVDDGSTDNTKQIVEKISAEDPRVSYFYQENKGLSAARNTGIIESVGEFFQFLDSDDLLETRKLELQLDYLFSHPEIDIVYGDMRYFSSDNPLERLFSLKNSNRPWMPKISGKGKEILRHLLRDNIMVVNSPLIRRRVVNATGLFDEGLNANEDWEYWLRCALNEFNFVYLDLPETLALVRHHPASMSKDPLRMISAKEQVHHKFDALLIDSELKSANRKALACAGLLRALEAIRRGHRVIGFIELVKLSVKNCNFEFLPYGIKLFVVGK